MGKGEKEDENEKLVGFGQSEKEDESSIVVV